MKKFNTNIKNPASPSQKAFIYEFTKAKIEIFKKFLIKPTSKS